MDLGELIKPDFGSALQSLQFDPSGEEVPFFGLAELLGLLHIGLVVIPVLCKDLDLSIVLLGEVGEFGPQFSSFIWRKKAGQYKQVYPRYISAKEGCLPFSSFTSSWRAPICFLAPSANREGIQMSIKIKYQEGDLCSTLTYKNPWQASGRPAPSCAHRSGAGGPKAASCIFGSELLCRPREGKYKIIKTVI